MKKNKMLLLIFMSFVLTCYGQTEPNASPTKDRIKTDVVIKNVSVIQMITDEVLANQDVIIKNGKIFSIEDTQNRAYENMFVVDGSGKYIMPSLADAHVHLPKEKEDLDKFLKLNLINGVTKLRSMRGTWNHLKWRDEFNDENSIYPKLYLSAPPIYKNYSFTEEELKNYVDGAKNFDFIKILSIKNQELFKRLDSLCRLNNVEIGGHFPNNISDSLIFNSNYRSFEHLGGISMLTEVTEERIQEIKKKNIYVCPTLSWYSIGSGRYSYEELRQLPGMEYIQKETIDNWIEKTKQYREKLGKEAYKQEVADELQKLQQKYQVIKRLSELGVRMLLSPDSSSKYMVTGFGMLGEMKLLKNAELSNFEILKMATVNYADFFNENFGTIEVNAEADFILLNTNPLESIESLKNIEAIYFNNNYLDNGDIKKLSESILPK
ncbi:amidohydrolase family protein [Flavobacterium sp. CS20]|jgi:hypothetical protein|uniref:amidohydrolase family protein n=1 Tax=Flavobacterium sp. CS20 TaxID=2775246 RepID=UPI001B39EF8F|nr:amidohydrolase family protein [Flavobacterium sp. CS20]QTY26328.1 amidohydrolase family protein [Flavobacterium sp. CS20]